MFLYLISCIYIDCPLSSISSAIGSVEVTSTSEHTDTYRCTVTISVPAPYTNMRVLCPITTEMNGDSIVGNLNVVSYLIKLFC